MECGCDLCGTFQGIRNACGCFPANPLLAAPSLPALGGDAGGWDASCWPREWLSLLPESILLCHSCLRWREVTSCPSAPPNWGMQEPGKHPAQEERGGWQAAVLLLARLCH